MLRGEVAGRYAKALYEIAVDKEMVDLLEDELKSVADIIESSSELKKFLLHPQITGDEKKELLERLFKGQVSKITENFIALLIDHRREMFLKDIVAVFVGMTDKARNIIEVQVDSVVELTTEGKGELEALLARLTQKKVRTVYEVDPSLIGGVKVRIGDRVIDGSIKNKLATLKEQLKQVS